MNQPMLPTWAAVASKVPKDTTIPSIAVTCPNTMLPTKSDFELIDDAYNTIWKNTAYTSFEMFNRLIIEVPCGKESKPLGNWAKFLVLAKPNLSAAGLKSSAITLPTDESLCLRPGLCTQFAIQVARKSSVKNILYGMTNVHRAAWKLAGPTAAVIDSSARQAIEFKDIRTIEFIGETTWFFRDQTLWFQKGGNKSTAFNRFPQGQDAWKHATQRCLIDLLYEPRMVMMFRQVGQGRHGFCGRMTWNFEQRSFSWSSNIWSPLNIVTFHPRGSVEEVPKISSKVQNLFIKWVAESKWRLKQYSPNLQRVQKEVWAAAVKHWGYPKHESIIQTQLERR